MARSPITARLATPTWPAQDHTVAKHGATGDPHLGRRAQPGR